MKKISISILTLLGMFVAALPCKAQVTTQMVQSAEMIVVGRFGLATATGWVNANINVEQVLKGDLPKGKELVVGYQSRGDDFDFKGKYLFFLKKWEVKDAGATPKTQWVQFLGEHHYGLEQATEQNLALVKRLSSGSERKSK
jgi:hypothetical protein